MELNQSRDVSAVFLSKGCNIKALGYAFKKKGHFCILAPDRVGRVAVQQGVGFSKRRRHAILRTRRCEYFRP